MSVPEWTKFRFKAPEFAAMNALAASNGGNNTTAIKETLAQWHAAVAEAGAQNAAELSAEDWNRLGHLNDPDPFSGVVEDSPLSRDWSQYLAMELVGMYEGRNLSLPGTKAEAKACAKLAERIASWGRVRGYALMAALRYFWRTEGAGILACVEPAVWLTPTAKAER